MHKAHPILTDKQLSFYRFSDVPNINDKLIELKHTIDTAGEQLNTTEPMLAEAMLAFELNIALFKEVIASCSS